MKPLAPHLALLLLLTPSPGIAGSPADDPDGGPGPATRAGAVLASGNAAGALELVDAWLGSSPGDPAALGFLREHRSSWRLAATDALRGDAASSDAARAALESVAEQVAGFPPASRWLALLDLEDFAFVELGDAGRTELCAAWLAHRSPDRRRLACEWMTLAPPLEELPAPRALIVRSLVDIDPNVRRSSAIALGAFEDPGLVAPLVRALDHGQPVVREHAAMALGWSGYEQGVPALFAALLAPPDASGSPTPGAYVQFGRQSAYVQDFDVEVATAAAIADPVIGVLQEGAVLQARVLSVSTPSHRVTLQRSIERLVGRPIGANEREWKSFWKQEGPGYSASLRTPERAPYRPVPADPLER